jgi:putative methionine-R-sulfoxide reductase with GAF domain
MQEFYINQGATLPILAMEIINDGRNDINKINQYIQNASIYFTMIDMDNNSTKIAHKPATIFLKNNSSNCEEEYYIGYMWTERDTLKKGTYKGIFEINFNSVLNGEIPGKLLVPIKEELIIIIK